MICQSFTLDFICHPTYSNIISLHMHACEEETQMKKTKIIERELMMLLPHDLGISFHWITSAWVLGSSHHPVQRDSQLWATMNAPTIIYIHQWPLENNWLLSHATVDLCICSHVTNSGTETDLKRGGLREGNGMIQAVSCCAALMQLLPLQSLFIDWFQGN